MGPKQGNIGRGEWSHQEHRAGDSGQPQCHSFADGFDALETIVAA